MTVYVDELRPWGRSKTWQHDSSCHMWCDGGFAELHELAAKIGLKREWFQCSHNRPDFWHYDLTASKRTLALQRGAIEMSAQQHSAALHEAVQMSERGLIRHTCGHRQEYIELREVDEDERRQRTRQLMSNQCSVCSEETSPVAEEKQ